MTRYMTLGAFVRLLAWWVGAMAWMAVAPIVAGRLVWRPPGVEPAPGWARWLSVVVGILSVVPWMALIVWTIARAEEYNRRVLQLGTAWGFAGFLVAHTAVDFARDAGLVGPRTELPLWATAAGAWAFGILLVTAYYRRGAGESADA